MNYFRLTLKLKNILKILFFCFIFHIFSACNNKGSQGDPSIVYTVYITSASCSTSGQTLDISLQNTAPYSAFFNPILADDDNAPSYYISCSSGNSQWVLQNANGPITIPPYGVGTVTLINFSCNQSFIAPCAGGGSSSVFQCNIIPFSGSGGAFGMSAQLISCP